MVTTSKARNYVKMIWNSHKPNRQKKKWMGEKWSRRNDKNVSFAYAYVYFYFPRFSSMLLFFFLPTLLKYFLNTLKKSSLNASKF